jgi:hypothetical protein
LTYKENPPLPAVEDAVHCCNLGNGRSESRLLTIKIESARSQGMEDVAVYFNGRFPNLAAVEIADINTGEMPVGFLKSTNPN